jgi:hypothetical protein
MKTPGRNLLMLLSSIDEYSFQSKSIYLFYKLFFIRRKLRLGDILYNKILFIIISGGESNGMLCGAVL